MVTKKIVQSDQLPETAISDLIAHLQYLYPEVVRADSTAGYLLRLCIAQLQTRSHPSGSRRKGTQVVGLRH
jgi:hypothetical protein